MPTQICPPSEIAAVLKGVDDLFAGEHAISLGARLMLGLSVLVNVFRDLDTPESRAEVLTEIGHVLTKAAQAEPGTPGGVTAAADHIEMLRRAA